MAVMGVSGSGKATIEERSAAAVRGVCVDGEDLHGDEEMIPALVARLAGRGSTEGHPP